MKEKLIHSMSILSVIAITNGMLWERIGNLDSFFAVSAFSLLFLTAYIALWIITAQKSRAFSCFLLFFIFVNCTFGLTHERVTGQFLSLHFIDVIFQEAGQTWAALATYWFDFSIALGLSFIGLVIARWSGKQLVLNHFFYQPAVVLLIFMIPIGLQSFVLYLNGGKGLSGQPHQFTSLTYFSFNWGYKTFFYEKPVRKALSQTPTNPTLVKDIVLIVDESIKGEWLDINNSQQGIKTNLAEFDAVMVNYGVAASATNCSAATNLILRTYTSMADPYIEAMTQPFIWEYAKKAGYQTYYLDGQFDQKKLQNFMTMEETQYIDVWKQYSQVDVSMKDKALGRELARLLNNQTQDFIYIQKMGAHFPYKTKYPHQDNRLQNSAFDSADASDFSGQEWLFHYRNAVQWNITEFFAPLVDIDLTQAFIIYTADHGQLFKHDKRLKSTHCNAGNVSADEGKVPLLVLTGDEKLHEKARSHLDKAFNYSSHFYINPTLIYLMGYSIEKVSLFDAPVQEPRFISNFNVRFGEKVVWNTVLE